MQGVATRGYDNNRSGVYSDEHILTADAVQQRGIVIKRVVQIPNDARGAEAQTLIAPNVAVDGRVRDLWLKATLANDIIARDVVTGELVWRCYLGSPIKATKQIDFFEVNDHFGILSTPVLDSATAPTRLYCCCWSSPDGTFQKGQHFFAGVDLATGNLVRPPINLEGAFYDPQGGLGVQRFKSAARKQRASLTFAMGLQFGQAGTVFIPTGSIFESAATNQGWVIAVDVQRWAITAAMAMVTSPGSGAGLWMAGSGLALDSAGFLYGMTANGDFDPSRKCWGESFVKMRYRPPSGAVMGELAVVDHWTPFLDSVRGTPRSGTHEGEDEEGAPAPTSVRSAAVTDPARIDALGNIPLSSGEAWDMDLGSGGPVLIPSLGIVGGGGKDGTGFLVRMDEMGGTKLEQLKTAAGVLANYQALGSVRADGTRGPVWLTHYPGPGVDPGPADIRDLNINFGARTHHQHGAPIVFDSPAGIRMFVWGENSPLRAWSIDGVASPSPIVGTAQPRFLAQGDIFASAQAPVPPGGMPGGMMCVSWDGQDPRTAVLWATIPRLDANKQKAPGGRFLAYRLDQLDQGKLPVVWDSWDWGPEHEFQSNKFTPPIVAAGQVYVPSFDAREIWYGLA